MTRIKIKPLKTIDELKRNVSSEKHFTFDASKKDEIMDAILKEVAKVDGVIAAQGPANGPKAISVVFKSKEKQHIFLAEPNPVLVYFRIAIENVEAATQKKNEYNSADIISKEKYERFIDYFEKATTAIIFLVTSVEAFFNQLLPDDIELTIDGESQSKSSLEWKDLKTKIKFVLPEIEKINFLETNLKDYNNIIEIQKIRNDLIHLKKETFENKTSYQELIKKVHDIEFDKFVNSTKIFMNTVRKDFIEEE